MNWLGRLRAEIRRIYNDGVPEPRLTSILALLVVAIVSAILIWWKGFSAVPLSPEGRTPFYYLLSTQAQVLGAILALVLTLSLVAAQLATRYAHRAFTQVFGKWLGIYLLPYLIGIAFPLFLLIGDFFLIAVRLSLLLAIICLILLVPYFVTLKRRLNLESIIHGLRETAFLGSQTKPSYATPKDSDSALQILDNMAMGAFQAHDFDSFELAINAMASVAEKITSQAMSDQSHGTTLRILKRLHNTGLRVLDDPSAPSMVISAVGSFGRATASRDVGLSMGGCEVLRTLGVSAATRGKDQVVYSAIHYLGSVGLELVANKAEHEIHSVYFDLRVLCVEAARQKLGDPAANAPFWLGQVTAKVSEQGRDLSVHQALGELGIMATVLLENGLQEPFRAIGFAAGQIGRSCVTRLSDYPSMRYPASQAADTLWHWAARSRARWNAWYVNSAFIQNLAELASLPDARPIVEQAYSYCLESFRTSQECGLVQALEAVKREFDGRI